MDTGDSREMPNQGSWNDINNDPSAEYLTKASDAYAAGDFVLAMHLYLAAYEMAMGDPALPEQVAVRSLRAAWNLACQLKERSMAEYVFEKLEPFLSSTEASDCAERLQDLALDRLEQFGFSRAELEDMADMLSQEFLGGQAPFVHMEQFTLPGVGSAARRDDGRFDLSPLLDAIDAAAASGELDAQQAADGMNDERATDDAEDADAASAQSDSAGASGDAEATGELTLADALGALESFGLPLDLSKPLSDQEIAELVHEAQDEDASRVAAARERIQAYQNAQAGQQDNADGEAQADQALQPVPPAQPACSSDDDLPSMPEELGAPKREQLTYRNLAGYDETISVMHDLGIGLSRDRGFQNFVEMMNHRHGLDRMPAVDSLLFRSPAREDALRFIDATVGELNLPVLRMSMEEGFQGLPVLCITTRNDNQPRLNRAQNRFEGPATLVLEDLDLWIAPTETELPEGIGGFVMANISRGAREAMNFIRAAVENPDVYVLVSAAMDGEIDPVFLDLLEPMTIVDIELPTERERAAIWTEIVRDHPSMRTLDRVGLMRYSAAMPRYDIYMAAREAVEDAYKLGLIMRSYQPVTPQNIYDKLAACQPLDSKEYKALEDEVIRDFRHDLDHLEDLLGYSDE